LALILTVSATAGFFLVYFIQSISDNQISSISAPSPEAMAKIQNRIKPAEVKAAPAIKTIAERQNQTEQKKLPGTTPPKTVEKTDRSLLSKKTSGTNKAAAVSQKKPLPPLPKDDTAEKSSEKKETLQTPEVSRPDTSKRDSHLYSAREFETQKNYSKALSSYKKALEADNENFNILNNIAFLYLQLKLDEDAIIYSQMALNINENYTPALINQGIALARTGNVPEAAELFERAASLEPENQSVFFNLAVMNEKLGNYDEASDYYSHLVKLGSAKGSLGLARIYEKQDMKEEALQLYKHIYALDSVDSSTKFAAKQRIYILLNAAR
jgi:tetratricopeptide (TPR) repeat protein